jgi:hypothetical protein
MLQLSVGSYQYECVNQREKEKGERDEGTFGKRKSGKG